MSLRFKGLVRAARNGRERLVAGIPVAEREAFLASMRRTVEHVESVCRQHDSCVDELPGPSRNAISFLKEVAATVPDDLPLPRDGTSAPMRIRVTRVPSSLKSYLNTMGHREQSDERLKDVFSAIKRSAADIERLCREQGSAPAGLPEPSARAYSLLKWLTFRENFDHYISQVRKAMDPFERASGALWPDSQRRVAMVFSRGNHLYKVRHCSHAHTWHLTVGFLGAGQDDLEDLALVISRRADSGRVARHQAFIDSADFFDTEQGLEILLGGDQFRPEGRTWDLNRMFKRLNADFFDGRMSRPNLTWQAFSVSMRRYGYFDRVRNVVVLNSALDDPRVPEYVPLFVMYHELLHKKQGFVRSGGRLLAITPDFRHEESLFPQKEKAERWLEVLAGGWDGRPLEETEPVNNLPWSEIMPGNQTISESDSFGELVSTTPALGKTGRNAPCPCGSGRKYKKCCITK